MLKSVSFKVKGMQRDLSASAFNPEYAYENKNIRIMPTTDNTLLSIINEKGNKSAYIDGIGEELQGTPIGQSLLDNELVIFTSGNSYVLNIQDINPTIFKVPDIIGENFTVDINSSKDRIYKLWFNNNILKGKLLYEGSLGFNYKYPIETLSFYENDNIRKVYWTDGLNQPRVINIAAAADVINKCRVLQYSQVTAPQNQFKTERNPIFRKFMNKYFDVAEGHDDDDRIDNAVDDYIENFEDIETIDDYIAAYEKINDMKI